MKTNLRVVVLATMSILVGACTPQGKGILGSNDNVTELVDAATKNASFGYDVVVDTISYNSCVSQGLDSSVIHGIKISAGEGFVSSTSTAVKAGVKLRSDFLQYVGKNFQPQYPSDTISAVQVQNVLRDSDLNKDAYIQFGVRRASDLVAIPDLIRAGDNGTKAVAIPGRDVWVIQKSLHQGFLGYSLTKDVRFSTTGAVLAEGPRIYNLSDSAEPIAIEAQFSYSNITDASYPIVVDSTNTENFGAGEQYADAIRKKFNSNGSDKFILTATFGGAAEVPDNLADTTTNHINKIKRQTKSDGSVDVTKAFGRGYQLKFESKSPGKPGWVANILTGVTEIDLAQGSPAAGASWTQSACESFVIVRSDHWNNSKSNEPTCSPLTASDLSTTRQLQLKKINRHYSSEKWNVGLFLPKGTDPTPGARAGLELCLSPKESSCYLPTVGIVSSDPSLDVGIQYDKTKECYLTQYAAMGQNYTVSPSLDDKRKLGRCAQYASICTRTSPNF